MSTERETPLKSRVSNDECASALERFVAQMFRILYMFRGEVNSFSRQLQLPDRCTEEERSLRFNLTIKSSIDKIKTEFTVKNESLHEDIKRLVDDILESGYPLLVKTTWLRCISLFKDTFERNFPKIEVHSSKEQYEKASHDIRETIDGFGRLTYSLLRSVEGISGSAEPETNIQDLDSLDETCSEIEVMAEKLTGKYASTVDIG